MALIREYPETGISVSSWRAITYTSKLSLMHINLKPAAMHSGVESDVKCGFVLGCVSFLLSLQSRSWKGLWPGCSASRAFTCRCSRMGALMEARTRTATTVSTAFLWYYATILQPMFIPGLVSYPSRPHRSSRTLISWRKNLNTRYQRYQVVQGGSFQKESITDSIHFCVPRFVFVFILKPFWFKYHISFRIPLRRRFDGLGLQLQRATE